MKIIGHDYIRIHFQNRKPVSASYDLAGTHGDWPEDEELTNIVKSTLANMGWDVEVTPPQSDGDEPYAEYYSTITVIENHREVELILGISGSVNQTVRITDPNITEEQLREGILKGDIVTSISRGTNVYRFVPKEGGGQEMKLIGEVLDVSAGDDLEIEILDDADYE